MANEQLPKLRHVSSICKQIGAEWMTMSQGRHISVFNLEFWNSTARTTGHQVSPCLSWQCPLTGHDEGQNLESVYCALYTRNASSTIHVHMCSIKTSLIAISAATTDIVLFTSFPGHRERRREKDTGRRQRFFEASGWRRCEEQ